MIENRKFSMAMVIVYLVLIGAAALFYTTDTMAGTTVLKFTQPFSPKYAQQTQLFEPWAKKLETHTKGQVTVKFFPGGALGKPGQIYNMVEKGIVDIGFDLHDYTPGRFPAISVFELPFMIDTAEQGSVAMWKTYEKAASVKKEHDGVKLLWLSCHAPGFFNTTKKPVRQLADLKGLKIRTASSIVTEALQLFGATPVTMPATEIYTALEKGVVDGTVLPYDGLGAFKLNGVVKHICRTDFYSMTFFVVMNQKKFDALSKEAQEFINTNMGEMMSRASGKIFDEDSKRIREIFLQSGLKEAHLSAEEMKELKKMVTPIKDKWVTETAEKGIDSKKLLEMAIQFCNSSNLQSKMDTATPQ